MDYRRRKKNRRFFRPRNIIIVIAAVLFSMYYWNNLRWKLAISKIEDAAKEIQFFCDRQQRCPTKPRGWELVDARHEYFAKDGMRYQPGYEEGVCTNYWIAYPITGGTVHVTGGIDRHLSLWIQ